MFLSGVQIRIRLDSRLKHAGMTELGMGISATQQAAENRSAEIEQSLSENNQPTAESIALAWEVNFTGSRYLKKFFSK